MNPNVSNAFVTTTDAAAAEKAICTTPVDQDHMPGTGGFVIISGHINVTPGTTTSAVVVRIRQGSGTGGTAVEALTHTLAATVTGQIAFSVVDLAPIAGGQYTLTLTQTAGAAAGTVNDAVVIARAYPQG